MTAPAAALVPDVVEMPSGTILEEERDSSGNLATAVFDATETYRYLLTRVWDPARPLACWIMLNPSTATAAKRDHTLRRVVDFTARFEGGALGGLAIVNLFAVRSRHPTVLTTHTDPVGPLNDAFINRAVRATAGGPVIAAWGTWGNNARLRARTRHVHGQLRAASTPVLCLGVSGETSNYQPLHPLMQPAVTRLVRYALPPA